jgi:hypothetical protein
MVSKKDPKAQQKEFEEDRRFTVRTHERPGFKLCTTIKKVERLQRPFNDLDGEPPRNESIPVSNEILTTPKDFDVAQHLYSSTCWQSL